MDPPGVVDLALFGGVAHKPKSTTIRFSRDLLQCVCFSSVVPMVLLKMCGCAFLGCDDRSIYAIDAANGNMRWSFAGKSAMTGTPAVFDNRVYVGSNDFFMVSAQRNALFSLPRFSAETRNL